MEPFVNEIILFLHSQEQSIEVNPTDCFVTDYDCLLIKEQKLVIITRYLSNNYDNLEFKNLENHRTIHLWEDVWKTSNAIIKSRLLSAIGKSVRLPGRVTQVRRIDKPTADAFLTEHHLQGSPKAKFKYGLFFSKKYYRLVENKLLIDEKSEEVLVAVATFSAPRTYYRNDEQSRSIELIRFTNHSKFTIIGGFNKLLKFLEEEQHPDDIMTYIDADWSDGKTFEKLGFERIEKTEPITFFVHKEIYKRYRNLPEDTSPENFKEVKNSGSWKMIRKTDSTKG